MKTLKRFAFFLIVLVAALAVVGCLLPAPYHVERSLTVNVPPEKRFTIAANFQTWENWTAWNLPLDPSRQRTFAGPVSGVGSVMSWDGKKTGQGEMTLTQYVPPKEFTYDRAFDHGKFESIGRLSFEPAGDGTTVTWIDTGDIGGNPFYRWMGLAMDKLIGPDFEQGLAGSKMLPEKP